MALALHVLCLDASECAALNEDFGGTRPEPRISFQRRIASCGAGAGGLVAQVALVASHSGKVALVLPPSDKASLAPALLSLPTGGSCSPCAALRLALLVARRSPSAHVTAFIASPCDVPADEALELGARIREGAVSVDVVVLVSREELGAEAVAGLSLLAAASRPQQESQPTAAAGQCSGDASSAQARLCRVVFVSLAMLDSEPWQQLEAVLEQLEREGVSELAAEACGGAAEQPTPASEALPPGPRGAQSGSQQRGGPARIRRAPAAYDSLHRPRVPLLAARSGVYQPALCRHESLDWLGHLSPDGMMRPWLPTYASLEAKGKWAGGHTRQTAGKGGHAGEPCYLQVCPLPKWRTVLRVSAGLMHSSASAAGPAVPTPNCATARRPAAATASSNNSSPYVSLSAALLHSLEALQLADGTVGSQPEAEQGHAPAVVAAPVAVTMPAGAQQQQPTAPAAPPVQLVPDGRRGTLRVLQSLKEPNQLKAVWAPDEAALPLGATAAAAALDMFGAPPAALGSGAQGSLAAALEGRDEHASGSHTTGQPLKHRGLEFWEAGASFEFEATIQQGTAVSGRVLRNGAQLLFLHGGVRGGAGDAASAGALPAFWLQQRWNTGCLPAAQQQGSPAAEVDGSSNGAASGADSAARDVSAAEAAAAGVLGLLAAPPPVDLRQLRRDIKEGTLQVTPITVGPLPGKFIQDIVSARAAIMRSLNMENCDTVQGQPSGGRQGSGSSTPGGSSEGVAGVSSEGPERADATPAAAADGSAGPKRRRQESPEGLTDPHPRPPVLSLLQRRLLQSGGGGSGAGAALGSALGSSEGGVGSGPAAEPICPHQGMEEAGEEQQGIGLDCTAGVPASHEVEAAGADIGDGSVATPFGTPLHIVPSSLVGAAAGPNEAERAALTPGSHVEEQAPLVAEQAHHQEAGEESVLFELD